MKTSLLSTCLLIAVLTGLSQPASDEPDGVDGIKVGEGSVQFIAEIKVPALAAGQLLKVNVRDFQSIQKDEAISSIDDRHLKDRQKVAEISRKLLQNKINSNLQQSIAETMYREAKTRHEANLTSQASSPGSIPGLELTRSALALKRAELELQSVSEQKEDLLLEISIKEAEVARVEHELNQLRATSPVSGVVLSVSKQAGEWVNVGETIATVARMDRLQVPVLLNEQQLLHRNAMDVAAVVRWQEKTQQFSLRGSITSVEPIVRGTDGYRAIVEVENRLLSRGWLLTPGRRVQVTVYPQVQQPKNESPATARLLQDPVQPAGTALQR